MAAKLPLFSIAAALAADTPIMNGSGFRRALRVGSRLYGTMLVSTSPRWLPLLAGIPLDFVFIDTERLPIDRHQLSWMCQAYRLCQTGARRAHHQTGALCFLLGARGGACRLIAPYIEKTT